MLGEHNILTLELIDRDFKDENQIKNKFGYFKNSILSNINKLNQNIEDLWEDDNFFSDLYDEK